MTDFFSLPAQHGLFVCHSSGQQIEGFLQNNVQTKQNQTTKMLGLAESSTYVMYCNSHQASAFVVASDNS